MCSQKKGNMRKIMSDVIGMAMELMSVMTVITNQQLVKVLSD